MVFVLTSHVVLRKSWLRSNMHVFGGKIMFRWFFLLGLFASGFTKGANTSTVTITPGGSVTIEAAEKTTVVCKGDDSLPLCRTIRPGDCSYDTFERFYSIEIGGDPKIEFYCRTLEQVTGRVRALIEARVCR